MVSVRGHFSRTMEIVSRTSIPRVWQLDSRAPFRTMESGGKGLSTRGGRGGWWQQNYSNRDTKLSRCLCELVCVTLCWAGNGLRNPGAAVILVATVFSPPTSLRYEAGNHLLGFWCNCVWRVAYLDYSAVELCFVVFAWATVDCGFWMVCPIVRDAPFWPFSRALLVESAFKESFVPFAEYHWQLQ